MKKLFIIFLLTITITGCNPKTSNSMSNISEYYLTYDSVDIKLGTFFSNIIATLGQYNNVREEESSQSEGTSSIYEFDSFEIETYFDNNIEKVYSIAITSDEQLTNEGIKIGDNIETMKNIYGLNYTNPIENIFIYETGNSNISFITENDIIIGIIYYLV